MQASNRDSVAVRRVRLERTRPRRAVATHRDLYAHAGERRCDVCDKPIDGDDGGSGLLLWTRGEEVRFEEPPLCLDCGPTMAVVAVRRWEEEDEEEG